LSGGVRYLRENAMNRCMGSLIAGLLAFSPAAQGQQLEDRDHRLSECVAMEFAVLG
jgi:hypothetical protein